VPLEGEHPKRTIQLGREMEGSVRHSSIELLWEYLDVFAFDPEEMPDIDLAIME